MIRVSGVCLATWQNHTKSKYFFMIKFQKFTLDNGLRVIVHEDKTTPLASVNLLYDVGARDEDPEKTGFAHLFEHLMFGGSRNIPKFDEPLELVGGQNNAFTNNDLTNYYETLPAENIETAFWLESDRMLELDFSEKSLEVQRNVVIEEYKQRYLNRPYGDLWLLLRPLAYKHHSYQWPTIGKDISHIEEASLGDVKDFFYKHYGPNNAILSVAGNVTMPGIKKLAEKWFGAIEKRPIQQRNLPREPEQLQPRNITVERDVPLDYLIKAYHVTDRLGEDYYITDLISDIFANGKSSRLHNQLVREHKYFSSIDAFITGSIDPGMIVFAGALQQGVTMSEAESALLYEIEQIKREKPGKQELQKVKNKVEANLLYGESSIMNKALSLAFHELIEGAAGVNKEISRYAAVTAEDITDVARKVLRDDNCSTLYYYSKNLHS